MSDSEKAKSIEKANAYRQMQNSWAWKDFELNILIQRRMDALEKGINAPNMEEVLTNRGRVKCIDELLADIGFIMSDIDG